MIDPFLLQRFFFFKHCEAHGRQTDSLFLWKTEGFNLVGRSLLLATITLKELMAWQLSVNQNDLPPALKKCRYRTFNCHEVDQDKESTLPAADNHLPVLFALELPNHL